MTKVRESFQPLLMAVNASVPVGIMAIGGFLCKTSGTISITSAQGTLYVDTVPVTAGFYTPIPIEADTTEGFIVTLAGGASGTLMR